MDVYLRYHVVLIYEKKMSQIQTLDRFTCSLRQESKSVLVMRTQWQTI